VRLLLFFHRFLYLQKSPVSTGTPVKFIAEEHNRLSVADLTKLNTKIAKFCTRDVNHNNYFRLVKGESSTMHPFSEMVGFVDMFIKNYFTHT
jgi:hypothetical protein